MYSLIANIILSASQLGQLLEVLFSKMLYLTPCQSTKSVMLIKSTFLIIFEIT